MSDPFAEAVRAGDPDRFAATLAAPPGAQARLWPVYAVNLEIARAPWASAEPLLAEMRLQWWVDALAAPGIEGRPAALRALAGDPAVCTALAAGAEARRGDCDGAAFADAEALADYLHATAGGVMWAAGLRLGAAPGDEPALRAQGLAQGLAAYLLAAPELAARGRDRLAGLGDDALGRLAAQALAARDRAAPLPQPLRPATYPGWLAAPILRAAAADPARIRAGNLAPSEFRRRAGLALLALTGRV